MNRCNEALPAAVAHHDVRTCTVVHGGTGEEGEESDVVHGGTGEEGEESDVVYVVDVTTESRLTCLNASS